MSEILRRAGYREQRVLIETTRILNSPFSRYLLVVSGAQIELLRNLMQYLGREHSFVSEYQNLYYLTPTKEEWDSLQTIVADLEDKLMEIALGFYDAYVCVRDRKAQNTYGGTFTAGAWRTRDINDEQSDEAGICTIASNQIVLAGGTYRCIASAPAYWIKCHQLRLYNITDASVLLTGTTERAANGTDAMTRSFAVGSFTLDGTKTIEVQHRCELTGVTSGFGNRGNFTDEIYAVAEFWREA